MMYLDKQDLAIQMFSRFVIMEE